MTIKHILLILASSLVLSGCEDASENLANGILEGVVIDSQTQIPIENAVISTNPASESVMTDAQGVFQINELEEGDYVLTVKRYGYDNGIENIKVRGGKTSKVIVTLDVDDEVLSSVVFSNPMPANSEEGVGVSYFLRWKSTADQNDEIVYDLKVFEGNSTLPVVAVEQLVDTFYNVSNLKYSSTHLWFVTAKKKNEQQVGQSAVWSFKTMDIPIFPFLYVSGNLEKNIYAAQQKADSDSWLLTKSTVQNFFPRRNTLTGEILFSAVIDGSAYPFVMDKDGSNVRRITSQKAIVGSPNHGVGFCWSPNGEQVLFCHNNELCRINKDGSGLLTLSTAPAGRSYVFVDWSDKAGKIVVQTRGTSIYDSEIYLMNPDGTSLTRIVDNLNGRTESPTFSSDGKYIVYTHDYANINDPYGRMFDSRIYRHEIASGSKTEISGSGKVNGTNDLQPRVSPDGSKIIFVNTSNTGTGQKDIYVLDLASGKRELYFENAEMPEWR